MVTNSDRAAQALAVEAGRARRAYVIAVEIAEARCGWDPRALTPAKLDTLARLDPAVAAAHATALAAERAVVLLAWARAIHARHDARHALAAREYEQIARERLRVVQALAIQDVRGEELSPALLTAEALLDVAIARARARLLAAYRPIAPS